jgi:hypothetical protein
MTISKKTQLMLFVATLVAGSLGACGGDAILKPMPILTGDWSISTKEDGKPVTGELKIQQLDEKHFRGEGKDVSPYYIVGLYDAPTKISFNKYYRGSDGKGHGEPVTWQGALTPGDSLKVAGTWTSQKSGAAQTGTWEGEQTRPAQELEVGIPDADMKYPDQTSAVKAAELVTPKS